jgi:hypothetical protein
MGGFREHGNRLSGGELTDRVTISFSERTSAPCS